MFVALGGGPDHTHTQARGLINLLGQRAALKGSSPTVVESSSARKALLFDIGNATKQFKLPGTV